MDQASEAQGQNQLFSMLWMANLGTLFAMCGFGLFQFSKGHSVEVPGLSSFLEMYSIVFHLIAVASGVLAFYIPKILGKSISAADLGTTGPIDTKIKPRLLIPYIVRIALLETVSLLGFVLAALKTNLGLGVPLMLVGIVLIFLARPSDDVLRRIVTSKKVSEI